MNHPDFIPCAFFFIIAIVLWFSVVWLLPKSPTAQDDTKKTELPEGHWVQDDTKTTELLEEHKKPGCGCGMAIAAVILFFILFFIFANASR